METAYNRWSTTFVFILFLISPLQCIGEKQYIFVQENKTWEEAIQFCQMHDGKLSDVSPDDLESIQTCGHSIQELWTSSYTVASPYLSLIGCFRTTDSLKFFDLQTRSVVDCQYSCSRSTYFAIKDRECACLDYITNVEESVDARLCNITCEGTFCGGRHASNVYSVVQEEFFANRKITKSKDFTSCVSYQCSNNTFLYNEKGCSDERVTQATCSSFFSCTFEPGDPCFLVQSENNDFNWTITRKTTPDGPDSAYEGSHFAFVNDSDRLHKEGSQASLVSNIDFFDIKDSSWCLRFRFSLRSTRIIPNITIYTRNMKDSSVRVYNQIFSGGLCVEWKYRHIDIKLHRHDRIFFNFTISNRVSNFALDDVTLTKGTCENTATRNLCMKGEVKCDFEGYQDTCFDQDKSDHFDWTIIRNGKTPRYPSTGPEKNIQGNYFSYIDAKTDRQKGHKAVLISKFELNNVNITFSMYYSMYGRHVNTLKVYLKKSDKEEVIMKKSGNQGRDWIFFNRTVVIDGTRRLYISANIGSGRFGNIAIDDIRIKLNLPDIKYNWMNLNKRCQRRLGVYTINHVQLPNLHCLSDGPQRWTAIIRPQRRGAATRAVQKQPFAVKLYRNVGSTSVYVWEEFSKSISRPFVCEKNSARAHCSLFAEDLTTNISGGEAGTNTELPNDITILVVVLVCVLTLVVAVALVVILYIRKRHHDNQSHTEVSYMNTSKTLSTPISSTEKQPKNVSIPGTTKSVELAGPHSIEECFNIEVKIIRLRTQPADSDAQMERENPEHYEQITAEMVEPKCYDHLITEKVEPAYYDDIITEKLEPANYEDLITEKTEPANYEDLITEKTEPANYEDLITEKTEPANYEDLITEKMEPANYEDLITKE